MSVQASDYPVGTRVRVTHQIKWGLKTTTVTVEGEVLRARAEKTGSWYAHSPDDKLWIDRIEIRKDDGELAKINLDRFSQVEILNAPDAA